MSINKNKATFFFFICVFVCKVFILSKVHLVKQVSKKDLEQPTSCARVGKSHLSLIALLVQYFIISPSKGDMPLAHNGHISSNAQEHGKIKLAPLSIV